MIRPMAASSRELIASTSAVSTRVAQAVRDRASIGSLGATDGDDSVIGACFGSDGVQLTTTAKSVTNAIART
jgi:hypothetical protein